MEKISCLKEYQQGAYRTEKAELEEVAEMIRKVLPLYKKAFLKNYWPYTVHDKKKLQPYDKKKYSISTNAMIMAMLLSISKKIGLMSEASMIKTNIRAAKKRYFSEVFKRDGLYKSKSDSYGENDPLNLYWASILCKEESNLPVAKVDSVKKHIQKKMDMVEDESKLKQILSFQQTVIGGNKSTANVNQQAHPFIALYACRGANVINYKSSSRDTFFNFFELRLHQHLSFYSIPDSRFDPAELVFCLEGMLLCKKSSVSAEVLNRVFEVLSESQNKTPCWRPVNPIYATQQGQIFLPLSIEVGKSLICIFEMIDKESEPKSCFSKCLPMLQRYFRWLKAQVKTVCFVIETTESTQEDIQALGWESEHVGKEGEIHLWQTALILEYLSSYWALLKLHIAKQYLNASGLSVMYHEDCKRGDKCTLFESNPFPKWINDGFKYNVGKTFFEKFIYNKRSSHSAVAYCNNMTCCNDGVCVLNDNRLCNMQQDDVTSSFFSLLLYGPPGTGKSFFTKEVAKCLRWKHITVTPSDFLADGSAEIEARAKGIFACLMEQENSVIIFDEIDQFILDRNSKQYNEQTDVFKLLTPGMLPKFQDLRDNGKCIFIIATNYAERIDPAVIRLGRVDIQIPLMPPSFEKRKIICSEKLNNSQYNERDFISIAKLTPFYSWKELTTLLKEFPKSKLRSLRSLKSFIEKNGKGNLTFENVLSRLKFNSNVDKNEISYHESVLEELALMCLIYGEEDDDGKNALKNVNKDKNINERIFDKIQKLKSN